MCRCELRGVLREQWLVVATFLISFAWGFGFNFWPFLVMLCISCMFCELGVIFMFGIKGFLELCGYFLGFSSKFKHWFCWFSVGFTMFFGRCGFTVGSLFQFKKHVNLCGVAVRCCPLGVMHFLDNCCIVCTIIQPLHVCTTCLQASPLYLLCPRFSNFCCRYHLEFRHDRALTLRNFS